MKTTTGKKAPKKTLSKAKVKAKPKGSASHDQPNPPKFVNFMLQGWKEPKQVLPKTIKAAASHKERRQGVSAAFKNQFVIVPTGHEKVRANDTNYRFRPDTSFYYLTGNDEADCVLVLVPKKGGHEHVLFVEPNPGRSEPTFFTDRHKGELWVGPRLGVPESQHKYGIDRCEALAKLPELLASLKKKKNDFVLLRGVDADVDRVLPKQAKKDLELAQVISEMRLYKDAGEIAILKKACKVTRRGFDDVARCLKTAKNEREVEGVFNMRARLEGNDVGYNVIAAAGANACILHWGRNDGAIKKNDLVLLDAGIELEDLYTADITRTIPASGKFTKPQREIYDLVRAAQVAAIEAVQPGNDFLEPHRAAMRVLAEGLGELGLLPCPVEEALLPENQFYKRYTLHGTSHMLGMDVHDCAHARNEVYRHGPLQAGMVLTIEPGLYFQLDDLTVPKKYRGIGVRIEDDVLVTAKGHKVLSDVPRDSADVEAWMAELWAE
ncbi:MAG: aminopeptidase P family protein [Deltaproteobacteria bacterium]|nr:aminopeptidase P family protein [Deltaproteobacteria bacterium]MBT6492134.1 aminopeptidase P family protein [Deltaproteobacteria bacterium]